MQLSELMANELLALRLRTATPAVRMQRSISSVAPTELIEPSPFLAGNELITLVGIGMNFDDSRTWDAYVERLAEVSVAGIVFNSGIAHLRVPQGLVDAGNKFEMPVMEVQHPVNLLQLYRLVNDTLEAERYALLRASLALADRCAALEASQTTVLTLLEEIARAVDGEVGLVDSQGDLVASHPHGMNWVPPTTGDRRPTTEHVRHLDSVRGGRQFSIVVRSELSEGTVQALLGPVGSIMSLHLNSTDEQYGRENDRLNALIEKLRKPDGDSHRKIDALMTAAGLDPKKPFLVVVVRAGTDVSDAWRLRILFSHILLTLGVVHDAAHLLFLAQDFDPTTATAAVLEILTKSSPRRPAIVTAPLNDLSSLRTALLATPKQLRTVNSPTMARRFDLSAVLATALTPGGSRQAREFLSPLAEYDAANNSDLLATLRAYLDADGSSARTAEALFIHRNSLTYRLNRIGELLGVSLSSMDGKTTCTVALSVWDS